MIEWRSEVFATAREVEDFLDGCEDEQALMVKVVVRGTNFLVFYPALVEVP